MSNKKLSSTPGLWIQRTRFRCRHSITDTVGSRGYGYTWAMSWQRRFTNILQSQFGCAINSDNSRFSPSSREFTLWVWDGTIFHNNQHKFVLWAQRNLAFCYMKLRRFNLEYESIQFWRRLYILSTSTANCSRVIYEFITSETARHSFRYDASAPSIGRQKLPDVRGDCSLTNTGGMGNHEQLS